MNVQFFKIRYIVKHNNGNNFIYEMKKKENWTLNAINTLNH